jgi:cardiolipin synthase
MAASPRLQLARDLVVDSAEELVHRPLQTGYELTTERVDHWAKVCCGAFRKRVVMNLLGKPDSTPLPLDQGYAEEDDGFPDASGQDVQPAHVELFLDGAEALAVLERLISQAVNRIDVLMFQWDNDQVGQELAHILAAKALPDLPVRVLVDGGGNLVFGNRRSPSDPDVNRSIRELAQQPNVDVIRSRIPFARFDHRKLVLIDGRIAWTGGRNFTERAFFCEHDLSLTVTGPLVAQLQECFDQSWCEQSGSEDAPTSVSNASQKQLGPQQDPGDCDSMARLLKTGPAKCQIEREVCAAIDHARRHVFMENFTFCDSRLIAKLARARRRGVDVRVVLTFSTAPEPLNRTNRVIANRLFRAGVRVYVYPTPTHVKAASVDGSWAYLGTGNFDPLSLRHNRELGLALCGGPKVAEVEERLFEADFCPDWEMKELFPLTAQDYFWEIVSSVWL